MVARSSLRACLVAGLPLLLQAFLLPSAGLQPAVPTARSKVATYCTFVLMATVSSPGISQIHHAPPRHSLTYPIMYMHIHMTTHHSALAGRAGDPGPVGAAG